MVASMFVQQRDNGLNVILLDDIQHLRTLDQNTIQHLQDSCHDNINIRVTTLIPIYNNILFFLYLVSLKVASEAVVTQTEFNQL